MNGLWIPVWAQVALLVGIPTVLVAAVPGRWLGRAILGWLVSPLAVYVAVLVWEGVTRPSSATTLTNALLGLSLISALLIVPWVVLCGVGFLVGFGLRRLRPARSEPKPRSVAAAAEPAVARVYGNDEPRTPLDDPKPATATETSPDGKIQIGFDWVEWRNSQWVRSPRVTDLPSGRVVLNLWGSDWDATPSYPRPRTVRLNMERFHFGGWLIVEIDLEADTYRIVEGANLDGPLSAAPLAGVADGLEAWWVRFAETAPGRPMIAPKPWAAWRTALVILGVAVAVIGVAGVIAFQQESHPAKPPLATVPAFRP